MANADRRNGLHKQLAFLMLLLTVVFSFDVASAESPDSSEAGEQPPPTLPTAVDWRRDPRCGHIVKRILNQGGCDSCVAIAVAAVLSDRSCFQRKSDSADPESYSPTTIVGCCSDCNGCNGTAVEPVLRHAGADGLWSEECSRYPIAPCDHAVFGEHYLGTNSLLPPCKSTGREPSPPCESVADTCRQATPKLLDAASVQSIYSDVPAIMREVAQRGSVIAAVVATPELFGHKGRRVLRPLKHQHGVPHVVRIVGYGVSETKVPYWIVANSWGTDWGDDGFALVERGRNAFSIETHIYSFDPM